MDQIISKFPIVEFFESYLNDDDLYALISVSKSFRQVFANEQIWEKRSIGFLNSYGRFKRETMSWQQFYRRYKGFADKLTRTDNPLFTESLIKVVCQDDNAEFIKQHENRTRDSYYYLARDRNIHIYICKYNAIECFKVLLDGLGGIDHPRSGYLTKCVFNNGSLELITEISKQIPKFIDILIEGHYDEPFAFEVYSHLRTLGYVIPNREIVNLLRHEHGHQMIGDILGISSGFSVEKIEGDRKRIKEISSWVQK